MRTRPNVQITAALLGAFLFGGASGAAPLTVSKDATTGADQIQTRLPLDYLGAMKFPNGAVKFRGNIVNITAVPDWLFDRHVVLSGRMINHKITTAAGQTTISGLAYFIEGDWIRSFGDNRSKDMIYRTNGATMIGRVRAINNDNLDFQTSIGQIERIKMSDISAIGSPRAYQFDMPVQDVKVDPSTGEMAANVDQISFTSSTPAAAAKSKFLLARSQGPQEPKSTLKGTEGGVTKSYIAGMCVVDFFNTFAPATIAAITLPHSYQNAKDTDALAAKIAQNEKAAPSVPFHNNPGLGYQENGTLPLGPTSNPALAGSARAPFGLGGQAAGFNY